MEKNNIPLQNAVALAYNASQAAPKVVAKGRGLVAEAIIARARESGVYVHESKELVSLLMQVDLDQQIPLPCTAPWRNCWRGYIVLKICN